MLPGFPVPVPGIVVVTADPIYTAALDSDLLKIFDEDPSDNPAKIFSVCRALRKTGRSRVLFVVWVVAVACF